MLKFYINNTAVDFIQSFDFGNMLGQPVSNFSFTIPLSHTLEVWTGDMFTISDNSGRIYYSGIISTKESFSDFGKKGVVCTGKNLAGFIIRDDADLIEYKNITMSGLINDVIGKTNVSGFGVKVEIDASVSSYVIKKATPNFGETSLEFVARIANKKGLYTFMTPDNVLHFKKPRENGEPLKVFDFSKGVDASIKHKIDITDAASDMIIKNEQTGVKTKATSSGFASKFTDIYASTKIKAGSKAKSSSNILTGESSSSKKGSTTSSFQSNIISQFFDNRAYAVLGTTLPPIADIGTFKQYKYFSISTDDIMSAEEQRDKIIRDNMPKCSIELSFQHIELGQINEFYRIINDELSIDGIFLLSGYSATMTPENGGQSTLAFTLPGFYK